ncbi:MAG: hypothetical protein KDB80_04750 [Planctomycetes bacterium]|nr:hypothetical protein [Planctomycetota bacterium]
MARILFVSLSLPLLTACTGLGGPGLVDLYDRAKPDGIIEIEADRNGTIHEMEADIPIADLPPAIRDAALAMKPGGTITGAERELKSAGPGWEVKLTHEGRAWEIVMDDAGNVLETEKELRRDEAPAAVLSAADAAIPGGTFKSIERIEHGTGVEYHVKKMRDGASYKIVLDEAGHVMRKAREARAEIEIPLR